MPCSTPVHGCSPEISTHVRLLTVGWDVIGGIARSENSGGPDEATKWMLDPVSDSDAERVVADGDVLEAIRTGVLRA